MLEPEEATRLAPRAFSAPTAAPDENERQIFSIRPTLMFVKVGYGAAVLGAFLLVALILQIGKWAGVDVPWLLPIIAGMALLLIPAYYHLRRNVIRYTLTDAKVEIDTGFVSQHTRNVPLRTIQDVSVSSSIPQRMLGFGDLVIENASEQDGKIILKNINSPKKYADILLKQMRLLGK
jgi:uncharacterized membrane protein YdbT with pleckstrin-like domain